MLIFLLKGCFSFPFYSFPFYFLCYAFFIFTALFVSFVMGVHTVIDWLIEKELREGRGVFSFLSSFLGFIQFVTGSEGQRRAQTSWRKKGKKQREWWELRQPNKLGGFLSVWVLFVVLVATVDRQPLLDGERGREWAREGEERRKKEENGQIMKQSVFVICARYWGCLLYLLKLAFKTKLLGLLLNESLFLFSFRRLASLYMFVFF